MKTHPIAAAVLALSAAVLSVPAAAATQPLLAPLTGGFLEANDNTDWLTFSLDLPTDMLITGFTGYGSWFTSVGLYSYTAGMTIAPSMPSFSYPGAFGYNFSLLAPGEYALKLVGYGDYKVYPAMTPVPEPETAALMLAGLGALGWVVGRRRRTPA